MGGAKKTLLQPIEQLPCVSVVEIPAAHDPTSAAAAAPSPRRSHRPSPRHAAPSPTRRRAGLAALLSSYGADLLLTRLHEALSDSMRHAPQEEVCVFFVFLSLSHYAHFFPDVTPRVFTPRVPIPRRH